MHLDVERAIERSSDEPSRKTGLERVLYGDHIGMPEAPAEFWKITGWPRCCDMILASARIVMSAVPPAGHGQMKVIGRFG